DRGSSQGDLLQRLPAPKGRPPDRRPERVVVAREGGRGDRRRGLSAVPRGDDERRLHPGVERQDAGARHQAERVQRAFRDGGGEAVVHAAQGVDVEPPLRAVRGGAAGGAGRAGRHVHAPRPGRATRGLAVLRPGLRILARPRHVESGEGRVL
ncbi:MAG: hypothetical protein AVDCRST_MAG89-4312, partial [uncultured Gemmatimonadetes bacterium]